MALPLLPLSGALRLSAVSQKLPGLKLALWNQILHLIWQPPAIPVTQLLQTHTYQSPLIPPGCSAPLPFAFSLTASSFQLSFLYVFLLILPSVFLLIERLLLTLANSFNTLHMAETVSRARFKLLFHVLLDAPPVLRPWSSSPALRDVPQVAHRAE